METMKTKRKYMEDEDMEFKEADKTAINKRNYSIEEASVLDVHYSRKWIPYNDGHTTVLASLTEL